MELFKIPAFRLRIRGHGTHHRVIIEAFIRPFGHHVVVVAHKPASAVGIHLVVGIETACEEVGIALGGVRLVELGRVLGRGAFAAIACGKGIADELDAAAGWLGGFAKFAIDGNAVELDFGNAAFANLDEAVLVEIAVVLNLDRTFFLGIDFELFNGLAVAVKAPAGKTFDRKRNL